MGDIMECTDLEITGASLTELYKEAQRFDEAADQTFNPSINRTNAALAFAFVDNNRRVFRIELESVISAFHTESKHSSRHASSAPGYLAAVEVMSDLEEGLILRR